MEKTYLLRAYVITRYPSFHRTEPDTFRKLATRFYTTNHTYCPIRVSLTYVELGSTGTSIIMAFPGNIKIRKDVYGQLKKGQFTQRKKVNRCFLLTFSLK